MLRCARKTYKLIRVEKIPDSNPIKWGPASVVIPGNATDSLQLDFFPQQNITAQLSKNTLFFISSRKTSQQCQSKLSSLIYS